MLMRTHLAISLFAGLLVLGAINDKIVFTAVLLIATLLPDIDNAESYISHKLGAIKNLFSFLSRHRGFFHSLTCCIAVTFTLALFLPRIALPFFMGYSMHILSDSFTIEGISAFWPHKRQVRGRIRVGGIAEKVVLAMFLLADLLFIVANIF